MKRLAIFFFTSALTVACGGTGPSQAEGPKPNLDAPPKGDNGGASGESMAALEAADAGDFAGAKAKADAVLAKNPNDAVAHFALGIVAEKQAKDAATAEKEYQKALELDPKLLGASAYLCALLLDQKKYDEAAKVARAGLTHAKGASQLHAGLAYALRGQGDHAAAAKSFANAVKLSPNDPTLHLDHGTELLATGDKDGAAKSFKEAVAHANGDPDLLKEAALGLKDAGDFVACAASLDPVIAKAPSALLYNVRAFCRHGAKDVAGARKDLDEAIKLEKPPSWRTHAMAAKYAEEAGDKKACRALYLETAKLISAEKSGTKEEEVAKKGADRCK